MSRRKRHLAALRGAAPVFPPRFLPGLLLAALLPLAVRTAAVPMGEALGIGRSAAAAIACAPAFAIASVLLFLAGRRGVARPSRVPPPERTALESIATGALARPLDDLVALPADARRDEVAAAMRRSGRRWVLLHDGRITGVIGAVPLRHLLFRTAADAPARPLAVAVPRVRADAPASRAFEDLATGGPPALVEDAGGRVVGFLTRRDIMAAGVGALPDERLVERPAWIEREGAFLVRAGVRLSDVRRRAGLGGECAPGGVGEALGAHLGRALAPGESVEWDGLRISADEWVGHYPARYRVERIGARG
jgi:CBS domain containing-hemolysin-like protein